MDPLLLIFASIISRIHAIPVDQDGNLGIKPLEPLDV